MRMMKSLLLVIAVLVVLAGTLGLLGAYNVAADVPHSRPVYAALEWARDRSIARRADDIAVPRLDDPQLLAAGAEHYAAMCTGCHLAPDARTDTELRAGLYPQPPRLIERGSERSPAETFWIIKHGIKATGMPAWGKTHDDRAIWGMVALLQRLPGMSAEDYAALTRAGAGQAHGHGAAAHGHEHGGSAPAAGPADAGDAADTPAHDHDQPATDAGEHQHGASEAPAATPGDAGRHEHGHDGHRPDPAPTTAMPGPHDGEHAAAGVPAEPSTEPVAVVERFFRRLAGGDTEGARALLDPSVLIYESGGVERSRDEYAGHHMPRDAEFLAAARHRLLARGGDSSGDLAYVASEARLSATRDGKPVELITTETMVLRRTDDVWRIVHVHWSNRPAPVATATAAGRPLALGTLTPELRAALGRGEGVGLATPAELNGYPGPKHVIELADALGLDARQRAETAALEARMRERALRVGADYVAAWDALSALWLRPQVDAEALRVHTAELGRLDGELRAAHLDAHREQAALLSEAQRRRYSQLRHGGS